MASQRPAAEWLLARTLPGKKRSRVTRLHGEVRQVEATLPLEPREQPPILVHQRFLRVDADRAPASHILLTLYKGLLTSASWKVEPKLVPSLSCDTLAWTWPWFAMRCPLAAMKCLFALEPGDSSTTKPSKSAGLAT